MEKFERRDIIKLASGAVVGTATGTLFSGAPFDMLQWLVEWTQDQKVPAPGEEKYLEGVCKACSQGCPISVRMIGNRAVKIETGNSGCARVQTALQLLYHPERVQKPLKRVGRKGKAKFEPVSWETAINDITKKIESLKDSGKGNAIAAIDGRSKGLSGQLLERLVKSCGSAHYYNESSADTFSAAAVNLTQNQAGSIYYDFENADYILSFGARLVEGWGDAARMNRAFTGWKARGAKYVQIDTLCTRSASIADKWIPIKAGTETILAMGIAYHLIKMGRLSGGANFAQWSQIVINDYAPERVTQLTGVSADILKQTAQEFASARNPIAVAGKGGQGVSSSSVEIAAIQALNSMVGSLGRGVKIATAAGLGEPPMDAAAAASFGKSKKAAGLDDFIKGAEKPELVFINEANPVHRSALGQKLAEKLEKASMVVAFMPLVNDTAAYADYVLPTISTLEYPAPKGAEPVAPRYKSMHSGDIILKIAKGVKGAQNAFPWTSYKDIIPLTGRIDIRGAANFTFPVDLFKTYLAEFSKKAVSKEYTLALVPFETYLVGDGDGMALPYVLKGIESHILKKGKFYVWMNPETADKEGVSENSSIDIESKRGEIGSVKVHLTKVVAPGVIAVPLGFGHVKFTEYAEDKGVNPKEIMSDDIDPISGTADWWFTRVKIS